PLDARFELRRGYLAAHAEHWPGGDAACAWADVFALFAMWASLPQARGLHSHTARTLAESLPRLPAYDSADGALREAFIALLRGQQPVETLKRMARLGVLGRWLPAFARVSGRMQFDLFHVYTVDQHTLAVLNNLAGFAAGNADERFAIAHEVWPRLRKPELLLLAALFHDIAKGRGGDHSELGAADARAFCSAHGLSEAETGLVAWLVQRHLLMSVTAQKQDIADPEVIHRFADIVADRERLDHLYLLTCADIAGTSPKLWNAWKDRLLADLYTATRLALRRGLEHPIAAGERIDETREAARALLANAGIGGGEVAALFAAMPEDSFLRGRADQVAWQAAALRGAATGDTRIRARALSGDTGALEVFVHSPDRDGLFAAIVATLDRNGLAIQQARLLDGAHGNVFDTFEVLPAHGQRAVAPEAIEQRLSAALAVDDLDRIKPARRAQPRHLRHFRIAPQVDFSATADGRRTLLSLVCTDRPGLLADVTRVLRGHRLRVHDARIATFGARAEDVFQITDERDRALDPQQQQPLREALLACLDGEAAR
ncbi:MAG: HD domain-containing protein, partial [Gammaproteobacteria bacterium]|nr:HD domain-containing protein [Gammaproteobacteria bacterium]